MAENNPERITDPNVLNAEVAAMNNPMEAQVPVFGHSSADYTLPCGYVDPDGVVHNNVRIRQMTGVEEEMMANDELIVTDRITEILCSVCERIGDVTDNRLIRAAIEDNKDLPEGALPLTAADRMAMLLFLRITSIGKVYRYDTTCPVCDHENKDEAIDLSTLKINRVKDPTKRNAKVKLPRSGVEVVLKILTGKGEQEVAKLAANPKDARTLALMARIEKLGGKPLPPPRLGGLQLVRQMPYQDRIYLRKVFDLMEGAIENEIEVICKKASCQKLYKFPLDLGQVFFSPQGDTVTLDSIEWM